MIKILIILFELCLVSYVYAASEEQTIDDTKQKVEQAMSFPYMACVTNSRVNVRLGPGTTYDILAQINAGEYVKVWEHKEGWAQIDVPADAGCWVDAQFIENNMVTAQKVNVRSGPNENYPVLVRLKKGDIVESIGQDNTWLKIKVPEQVKVWIDSRYITFYCSAAEFQLNRLIDTESQDAFQKAEQFRQQESKKPLDVIDFNAIIAQYSIVVNHYPQTAVAAQAQKIINEYSDRRDKTQQYLQQKHIQERQESLLRRAEFYYKGTISEGQFDQTKLNEALKIYKEIIDQYPGTQIALIAQQRIKSAQIYLQNARDVRSNTTETVVSSAVPAVSSEGMQKSKETQESAGAHEGKTILYCFTGIVDELGMVMARPGTHKLIASKKKAVPICVLSSKSIDLDAFTGKKVKVWGYLIKNEAWDIPCLDVTEIKKKWF